jgi:predicted RNase H-like nuclease (RuvC/YqgF family)
MSDLDPEFHYKDRYEEHHNWEGEVEALKAKCARLRAQVSELAGTVEWRDREVARLRAMVEHDERQINAVIDQRDRLREENARLRVALVHDQGGTSDE